MCAPERPATELVGTSYIISYLDKKSIYTHAKNRQNSYVPTVFYCLYFTSASLTFPSPAGFSPVALAPPDAPASAAGPPVEAADAFATSS
jgi:hypothetical protein